VIIYNNTAGSLTGETDRVSIPVVGIAADAGPALSNGATATVTVPPAALTGHNVVAKPKGAGDCTSVTGGHYDSVPVTGGADDNASGAAAVVEVARVAAANHVSGANCFVLFSGEEFGLFGSKAFINALSPDQINKVRLMINLDVVGISGALGLIGDADLVETARLQAQKLALNAEPSELPQGAGSDHLSFRDAGIPVLMLSIEDNLIHTQRDAIDRIDIKTLDATVRLAYATLAALSAS
jgi:Zn-dependent M28 family amino/carboxypeptidase